MNRKALKAALLTAAGVLVTAVAVPAIALSAQDERKTPGQPKIGEATAEFRSLQGKASRSEAQINRSAELRDRMIVAAKGRDVGAARKVLMETGFTAQDLEGVPIKFQPGGGGGGSGGEAGKFKIVRIELKCCPPELIIVIQL